MNPNFVPAQFRLVREFFTDKSTIGNLFIEGNWKCYTLEDTFRFEKIMHQTCIPAGTYQVVITFSDRFQKPLPLLLNVKGFDGIRIHPGNSPADTSGCILPGMQKDENDPNRIIYSKKAFDEIFETMKTMLFHQKIYIEIVNAGNIEERIRQITKKPEGQHEQSA